MASQAFRPCRLSVAMIVRDEEDVLADSIESVRSIADEVVVLDTGSRDRTVAAARESGARVVEAVWTDDFSAARNRVLSEVCGDWVLWLDAGERLAAETESQLREFLNQEADSAKVYRMMIVDPAANPGASDERKAVLRLMPRRDDLRFTGRVRETLRPAMQAAGLTGDIAPGRIVRHLRDHDARRKAAKARRDLRLVELELAETGIRSARLLIAQGEAYGNLDQKAQARQAFQEAVEAARRGTTEMLEAYFGLLTALDGDENGRSRQLTVALAALEVFPLDALLLLAIGNYLHRQGRTDLACRAFETAVQFGQVDLEAWHLTEIAQIAMISYSLALQIEGKAKEGCRVLEDAAERYPESARVRRHLADAYVKLNRIDQAVLLAEKMAAGPREIAAMGDAARGACYAAAQNWTPALAYLQGAYLAGCRHPLCLRWLAVTLLSNGQTEGVQPVLEQWLAIEPDNAEARTYLAAVEERQPPRADRGESRAPAGPARQFRVDAAVARPVAAPLAPVVDPVRSSL